MYFLHQKQFKPSRLTEMLNMAITPTSLQAIISLLLLFLIPYAMSFTPYEGIYQNGGPWEAPLNLDPLYTTRAILIAVGLLGSAISSVLLIWKLKIFNGKTPLAPHFSMTLFSLATGWIFLPYWVNGMYQAYSGNTLVVDFDPKALMPYIWIGDIWTFGVVGIILIIILMLALVLSEIIHDFRIIKRKDLIITIFFLAITLTLYLLSPNYGGWFID